MGLFVKAKQVKVDNGQPPGNINLCPHGDQFTEQNGYPDTGRNKFELFGKIAAFEHTENRIKNCQEKLYDQQNCDPNETV